MKDNDVEVLFNVPYSPDYNPIEKVFNILKQKYKKLRLSAITNNHRANTERLIN